MSFHENDIPFEKRLKEELELWLEEGIISRQQKERLLSRYQVLEEADETAGPGRLITTVSMLGAVLIGAGIILFIASNWAEIPRWGKLFMIFSSMLTCYGLGFYLGYEKKSYPTVGGALIFLGSIIFGAGIFLIAQIYHITVHYPNGPLLWGLGILPLAYLFRYTNVMTLAIVDLLIWVGTEASFWMPESAYPGNIMPYVTLFLMTGLSLWTIGLTHRRFVSLRDLSGPYIVIGMLTAFSMAYVLTFDIFRSRLGAAELAPFYIATVGLFIISGAISFRTGEREKAWVPEAAAQTLLLLIALLLSLFFAGSSYNGQGLMKTGNVFNLMTFTANMVFAFIIIGTIILGYVRRYPPYINIGLLFFVLDVFARYFDFFWKLLPRSLFFIIGGLMLLIGGVLLENKRKKVLASFHILENE
jgi:uncharacterized membrane protein